MTLLNELLFHLDDLLYQAVSLHPIAAYFLFLALIFGESAFFPLAPFLPGDGLLFGVGVMAANGLISLPLAIPVLIIGGMLGNWVAWQLGSRFGVLLFERFSWLNRKHFEQAHEFYQKYGSKAFLFSRFVPVVRALVPFVAGVAKMNPLDFKKNNLLSVSVWVCSITLIAYFLGHIPFVKHHFTWIIFGAFALGFTLMVIVAIRHLIVKPAKTDLH